MKNIFLFLCMLNILSCNSNSSQDSAAESTEVTVESPSEDDYKIINSTLVHLVQNAPPELEREFGYDNFLSPENSIFTRTCK